jgi:PAS domain S-box-containing protein
MRIPRLSRVLVLFCVGIGLFPLLLTAMLVSSVISRDMEEAVRSSQSMLAMSVAQDVELFLAEPVRLLSTLANVLEEGNGVESDRLLSHVFKGYSFFSQVQVLDSQGIVTMAAVERENQLGLDLSRQPFFEPPADNLRRWWSRPFISPRTGEATLALCIRADNHRLLVGYLDLSFLSTRLTQFEVGENGYVILMDKNGVVLAHPNKNLVYRRTNISFLVPVEQALIGRVGFFPYTFDGIKKFGTTAIIPETGWILMVTQPVVETMSTKIRVQRVFWSVAAGIGVLIFWVALLFARRVSRALNRLVAGTKKIAAGEYEAKLPEQPYQELASLAESMAFMARAVQEREARVVKNEEKLTTTLQSIGEGVVSLDTAGRVDHINREAEKMIGVSRDKAKGMPAADFFRVRDENGSLVDCDWANARMPGSMEETYYLEGARHSHRPVMISGAPIVDASGAHQGAVWVFRDVSERHRIEEQLRHSQKMETVGRLAGGVAHDFNNMVAGIISATEALSMKIRERPDLFKYVLIIAEAADRAADLTRKLLDFSRKGKAMSTPVDVHQSIQLVLDILKRSVGPAVRIETRLEADVSTMVGDPTQLQNALLNLAINAKDAMPAGGVLTISTVNVEMDEKACTSAQVSLKPGMYIRINVCDTGEGMEPEVEAKIFEPFFSTKPQGQGTGLGLPAVYGMTREHGGAVTVYSRPGQGSCFSLYLPATRTNVSAGIRLGCDLPLDGTGIRVLVVDDERMIRDLLADILGDMGFSVLSAASGRSALDIYRRRWREIDLVLMDVIMPEMSGRQAFEAMRHINPQAKVIFTSGFSHEAGRGSLEKMGAAGFLAKPYKMADLMKVLRQAGVGRQKSSSKHGA